MYVVQCTKTGNTDYFHEHGNGMTYDAFFRKNQFVGERGLELVNCGKVDSRCIRLFPTKAAAQEFIDNDFMPATLEDDIAAQFEPVKVIRTIKLAA